jgi:hypothetical protein
MNGASTDAKNSAQAAARWMVWVVGGLGVGLCVLTLLLWGLNGPSYILDLIAAYCGF